MEKIIVDEKRNAYSFDGKQLKHLGEIISMRDVWKGKVFAFGNDFYLKTEEGFSLLAENAYPLMFEKEDDFALKQFELIGDVLVMNTPNVAGFQKLDKAYASFLTSSAKNEKPILALYKRADHSVFVLVEDEMGNIRQTKKPSTLLGDSLYLLGWNYRIYFHDHSFFKLKPFELLFAGDNYLVFSCDDIEKHTVSLNKDGDLTFLGTSPKITRVSDATLLEVTEGVYHLKEDDCIRIICCTSIDEYYSIEKNGDIFNFYVREQSDAPDLSCKDTYRLVNGAYQLVKREDQ